MRLSPKGTIDVDESGEEQAGRFRIAAELKNLSAMRRFVKYSAGPWCAGKECIADLIQAVDEAATNVIMYGYKHGPGAIELEIVKEGEQLLIMLRDEAPHFDPTTVPPPDLSILGRSGAWAGLGRRPHADPHPQPAPSRLAPRATSCCDGVVLPVGGLAHS